MKRIILVCYATPEFSRSQNLLINSALIHGITDIIKIKDLDIKKTDFYQKHIDILSHPRGAGYWLWKPYIILETLKNIDKDDYVVYVDSGIEIIDNIRPLIKLCNKSRGILLFKEGGEHKNCEYTKRDCFVLMKCDKPLYWNAYQCLASFQIYQKSSRSLKFVNEWLNYCTDPRIISDDPNICKKNNFIDFVDHRHDQSVLSLLAFKNHLKLYRDPTQWGNPYKLIRYRKNKEFLHTGKYISEEKESDYPTILNHHRNNLTQFYLFRKLFKYKVVIAYKKLLK